MKKLHLLQWSATEGLLQYPQVQRSSQPLSYNQSINPTNNSLTWNTGVFHGTAHHSHDKSQCSDWDPHHLMLSRYELRKVFPLQAGLGLGPAPAHQLMEYRTCIRDIYSHSFHLWDRGSSQWDVTSTLRPASQSCNALAPGPAGRSRGVTGSFSAAKGCAK